MDIFTRTACHVLHIWARAMLTLTELVWGIGDLPDERPGMPDYVDFEYFGLLDQEEGRE